MRIQSLKTLLAWVSVTAVVLVILAIVSVDLMDKLVIAETAAMDRHNAFLRATAAMSRSLSEARSGADIDVIARTAQEIMELRPGLRRLSFFDMTRNPGKLVWTSDSSQAPELLPATELLDLQAGRSTGHFDESTADRAWIIAAPITIDGRTIGALRGRFSVEKFDHIAKQERERARVIAVGMVLLTCLVFFALIQLQVHRPIHRLLEAMRRAEAGDLMSVTKPTGPTDLQEVAWQFNRMLARVRKAMTEKETLLGEIRDFNESLTARVAAAKQALQRTHAMLVDARIDAERNEKLAALGELSAIMAHELGNPLNAISGHLQLLSKARDHDQMQRHLSIVKSETDRMVGTIGAILQSTRIRGETMSLNINDLVRNVLSVVAPTTEGENVTVKTSLSPHIRPIVGDARALHGLIFNLVTNAIHAMPGGGELEIVTTDVVEPPHEGHRVVHGSPQVNAGAVRLLVRDTGVGIAAESLSKIFEPFYSTRHDAGGTGLGLTICERTVTAHGGRLAVQSAPGVGTQFTVDLPAVIPTEMEGESIGHA
jgi:signal transduction histidine kinase